MIQKLEDFWTYKDWEVLLKKKRPRFGPLIKVHIASCGPSPQTIVSTDVSSSKLIQVYEESSDTNNKSPAKTGHQHSSDLETADQNNNEFDVSAYNPGWYNIQRMCQQYEDENEIDCYNGCYITNEEFEEYIKTRFPRNTKTKHKLKDYAIIPRKTTSSIRRKEHLQTRSYITSQIDQDIADIAAEMVKQETPLEVSTSSEPFRPGSIRTKMIKLDDSSEITVNIFENHTFSPLHRPFTNKRTTPVNPVQRKNAFHQILITTTKHLQRIVNKLNFMSTKQRTNPESPLFRCKCECKTNFTNFWDTTANRFINLPSFQCQSRSTSILVQPQTHFHVKSKPTNFDSESTAKIAKSNAIHKQRVSNRKTTTVPQDDLFAAPLFIPSKQ